MISIFENIYTINKYFTLLDVMFFTTLGIILLQGINRVHQEKELK